MFAEMLTHSEEKIFLEAIDQYFESESFEDISLNNKEILLDHDIMAKDNETESDLDKRKETDIEIMNIKFYEALNIGNNNTKDVSTDFESEDCSLNTEKIVIKISDCLILSKDAIEKSNQKVLNEYKKQIIFDEKIKELFKKDINNIKPNKNYSKIFNNEEKDNANFVK